MPESFFWLFLFIAFLFLAFYAFWYRKTRQVYIPPDFLDGINFLLDQQHDKAIKAFVDLFEVNANTIEIHIILGGLFRQKGEFDKAIDIHQNIIGRCRDSSHYRVRATFELGKDYYHAGLLGHAEDVLKRSAASKDKNVAHESSRYLLMLYEAEKNWEQAISLGRKMMAADEKSRIYRQRVTHYYCEMAQIALDKGNETRSRQLIARAESLIKKSFRITLLRGDLECASSNFSKAMQYYEQAFRHHPQQAMIILPRLMKLLQRSSAAEVCTYLEQLDPKVKTSSYLLEYAHALIKAGRDQEAENLFAEVLKKKQVCMPLLRLVLENKLKRDHADAEDKKFFSKVLSAMAIDDAERYAYSCVHCAFDSRRHYWCCPSCRLWDTCAPLDLVSAAENKTETQKFD